MIETIVSIFFFVSCVTTAVIIWALFTGSEPTQWRGYE